MKRILFFMAIVLAFFNRSSAQHTCSTQPAPSDLLVEYNSSSRAGGPYTIPVVFHIHHDTVGYYNMPSCTEILEALDKLNRSFNALSDDTIGISTLFKPLIGNAQVNFELARLDELGNCISGIQYHYMPNPFSINFANINLNTNHYLNIHVFPLGGYAMYPTPYSTTPDPLNGVYVGGVSYGPLLAHEVGHWLGLMHTFGNVNQVGVCGDDLVFDTPVTDGSPGTCDTNRSVCTPGVIENVQNYMDYSSCYRMFTHGQVGRMHAMLDDVGLSRHELYTVPNLALTGVSPTPSCAFTAGFTAFRIGQVPCTYNAWVRAVMTNFTTVPDSVHWTVPGGTPSFHSGTDLDVYFAVSGMYTITMTAYSNGVASTSSRTMNINRYILDEINVYPFAENFENSFSFPDDHLQTIGAPGGWQTCNFTGYNSATSLYVPMEADTGIDANTFAIGVFNLDSLDQPHLSFRVASTYSNQSIRHKLRVRATDLCNNTSYTQELLYDSMMALTNTPGNFIPSAPLQWKQVMVNLSFLPHSFISNNILISVILEKDFTTPGQDSPFYLDNINVNDSSAMLPPVADFTIANKDFCYAPCYQLELVDRSTNMPSSWDWQGLGNNVYTPVVDGCHVVFPIDSVPVTLIVSNDFGSDTCIKYIYTHTPPMFSITTSSDTICEGDTLMMSAPPGNGTYTWANGPEGSPNPGLTLLNTVGDTAYAIPVMFSNNYYATLTNEYGCKQYSMITVIRQFAPFLNITVPTCVSPGDTVQLITDNVPNYNYSWAPSYGLNSADTGIVNASPDSTVTYTVTVSYDVCSRSQTFTLHVPAIFSAPADPVICEGDSVFIQLSGSDNYQWNPSSGTIQVLPGNDAAIAFPLSTNFYTVTGTVTGGCTSSSQVEVEVYPYPVAPAIQVNGSVLTSSPAFSYQWMLDGIEIPGATSQQYTALVNGVYSVVITNEHGCSSASMAVVIHNVSIETLESDHGLVLFPNPSSVFSIKNSDITDPLVSVSVYNAHGQCIQTFNNNINSQGSYSIQAANGMYFVKVLTQKGKVATLRLILAD